ncbi:MAG: DNA helicase [Verrucomicrobiaceae bacterium]|nr:MAG: DNA helicase [Verrucomicrobiaceae bacterium]
MDWASIVGKVDGNQYPARIAVLKQNNIVTDAIEETVEAAVANYSKHPGTSFVVFGEPQSGKTEMMIALNARLLDEGCQVIINLLTDSVDLLNQSLARFRKAGLSPSPKQFADLPMNAQALVGKQWIIFSKKNAKDLEKLNEALRLTKKRIVIDDEADYASPNSKINSDERTKINTLINDMIGDDGQYIGVTATPARLDLNNTFENQTDHWVYFKPHKNYVGQDFFFPGDGKIEYRLKQFPADEGSERTELRNAIMAFLCGVAHQWSNNHHQNFTMLVHTSGKISEHKEDLEVVQDFMDKISNPASAQFKNYCDQLVQHAKSFDPINPAGLVTFVLRNIRKHQIVEINSDGKKANVADLLSPTSLFSFGIGGNIISRGVTFENLLSLYFTRSVKGKLTQDTYIQRARMFGNRAKYKNDFQLWIPEDLYTNWAKCFAFHKLAVEAVRSGRGAPVWLSDHKSTPTSSSSIDRSSVDFEGGEMSFALFDYDAKFHEPVMLSDESDRSKLNDLRQLLPGDSFPEYVLRYLEMDIGKKEGMVCFHSSSEFGSRSQNYTEDEIASVRRKKGVFSTNEFKRGGRPEAKHHLKIFFNASGRARLFYKINGKAIQFMQNRR